MPDTMKLILTTLPEGARQAAAFNLPVGLMAYRVGPGARLLRANMPIAARGALMVVDGTGCDSQGEPVAFCQDVLRECGARGFSGVILDFEEEKVPLLEKIANRLEGQLARRGWPLYVTEGYAACTQNAVVIVPSALSGGSLSKRLEEAVERWGRERVALGVQRAAEDFTLPSPTGSGTPLTRAQLKQCMEEREPAVFFSGELCAHYFTYTTRQGGAHFVLFDDAGSIRKKLAMARAMGLPAALLAWPEVDDILGDILS